MAMDAGKNAPVAFLLVCGSGLATTLGASVVYSTTLVNLANKTFLACALGFSSGVMLYVSFIEIFYKAKIAFEEGGMSGARAYQLATLCFFGGYIGMKVLHFLIHHMSGEHIADHRGITESEVDHVSSKSDTPMCRC